MTKFWTEEDTQALNHYKRLTQFFQDWGESQELLPDLMGHNLRLLRTLVLRHWSGWDKIAKVHYLVLSVWVGSVAVPIYGVQLEKIEAFSQAERKTISDTVNKPL